MVKRRNVADNVHGLIRCTLFEARILNNAVFNRLHDVYQNSAAYLTWPSTRNKRFEHSLGTMHLAGRLFNKAVENAGQNTLCSFLDLFALEIGNILGDIATNEAAKLLIYADSFTADGRHNLSLTMWSEMHVLSPFQLDDASRQALSAVGCELPATLSLADCPTFLVPGNVADRYLSTYYLLVAGIRLAALMHDVGHPPFSHAVEKALRDLYEEISELNAGCRSKSADAFLDAIDSYFSAGDGSAPHELIGIDLIDMIVGWSVSRLESAHSNSKTAACDCLRLEYYVVGRIAKRILLSEGPFDVLHELISGTVDADRLDYVNRDSLASGLGSDPVRYSRLIDGIMLIEHDGGFRFAFDMKSITTIEAFLKTRYRNYATVIFHHRVVKTEALMTDIVKRLGHDCLSTYLNEGDLEIQGVCETSSQRGDDFGIGEGDYGYYRLPTDISGLWRPFVSSGGQLDETKALRFGQWNDSWFSSMLSGELIRLYDKSAQASQLEMDDKILRDELSELLYSRPAFVSMIKRIEDVDTIDAEFMKLVRDEGGESNEAYFAKLRESLLTRDGEGTASSCAEGGREDVCLPARPTASILLRAFGCSRGMEEFSTLPKSPLNLALLFYDAINVGQCGGEDNEKDFIRRIVGDFCEIKGIPKFFVEFQRPSIGISDDDRTLLYNNLGNPSPINSVSRIRETLNLEEMTAPRFFVFLYVNEYLKRVKTVPSEALQSLKDDFFVYVASQLYDLYSAALEAIGKGVCLPS